MLQVSLEVASRQSHSERDYQSSIDAAPNLSCPSSSSSRNNLQVQQSQNDTSTRVLRSHHLQSLPFNVPVDVSRPLELAHPPPASILFLWQTYLDVIDPLIKIFHVPSIQRQVMTISQGRKIPDADTECLLFAIYYSTVIAISAAECRQELHEERPVLLQRFRNGVEESLRRINFWSSRNTTALQAFVLYLICGRQDRNGPDVSSLTGIAIGNGMKLNVHIDIPGMRAFDLEMRRRLWWQICTLDVRVAEEFGREPFILEPSLRTELPLNISDMSLDPDIRELPSQQPGRSEMLFSLVRFEVSNFARRIVFSDRFCQSNGYRIMNEEQKCREVDQFGERLEKQYLSYCDKGVPLDCITVKSSQLILANLKLAVCKPRANQNRGIPLRAGYRKACEEVLQHAHALRQYSKGRRWLWLFQTYVEWDALAYLLLDICITLSSPSSSEPFTLPWEVIDETHNHWKNNADVHRGRRWDNIEVLRSQALSVIEKMRNTAQTPQTSSSSSSLKAQGQFDGMSDTTIESQQPYESSPDSTFNQHTAMAAKILIPPGLNPLGSILQTPLPYVTDLQSSDPNTTDKEPQGWAPADASSEEGQVSADTADLPGAGTVCEWSSSLIERYWEVAGQGYDESGAWHSSS
ncbi:fungal specific transcription factor domain-containing protein [Trichoderma breve]|uniref:Fungal specific transcription factor domain-containing protein n=1 Tax=Trichoderma breve TaxID=2034170 RepID=A0A9W9BGA9_9HYPO|nr:fungal specific transcription factor domain-containing protein [Trichoderma breve]KAJ4862645.1 fungal specific transcription factor domain-containing protein [Trichoderma breve]